MSFGKRLLASDLALRAIGIMLAIIGGIALRHLSHLVHVPPRHEASATEMGFAALGFLGLSAGSGLLWLGRHIHDRVPISARWAMNAPAAQRITKD